MDYFLPTNASPHPGNVVIGPDFRFTVITERLVRMEYQRAGQFVDAPTWLAINRNAGAVDYSVSAPGLLHQDGYRVEGALSVENPLIITTRLFRLTYNGGPFTPASLSVQLSCHALDPHPTTWHYGDKPVTGLGLGSKNLGGTARTLDEVDGPCPLEPGLLSRQGYAVLDDSSTVTIKDWPQPTPDGHIDMYYFGAGQDYRGVLKDYFTLSGPSPLIPRWALGNWWSRYFPYSEQTYLELMDRFTQEQIPFSVAVIDMDWHLVDIDPEDGVGWTGYTWNRELFPNPPRFLAALHQRNLKVTLNVHPADGFRHFEDAYAQIARSLGIDPDSKEPIAFDITAPTFVHSYFVYGHHPHEADGVDFWWIDWQQGTHSRIRNLDPLWMLNHCHYLDSGRNADRRLTFSRYAGPGSHRYPIGFSGDTVISWDSLRFQPYFTATAANIGYFWWSHDIGGHMLGIKDNELATRWVQLGVFSPINRLHSSCDMFSSKEPWRFGPVAAAIQTRYLQLRHRLIPYLYTAMWQSHTNAIAPIRPLYHDYPNEYEAYTDATTFAFGPDLIVVPITTKTDPHTHLATESSWLPQGQWCDIFSAAWYQGGSRWSFARPLDNIVVLARAGAIIPMLTQTVDAQGQNIDIAANPDELALLCVHSNTPGSTELIEDDGGADPTPSTWMITSHWEQTGRKWELTLTSAAKAPTGRKVNLVVDILGATAAAGANGSIPEEIPGVRIPIGTVELDDFSVTVREVELHQDLLAKRCYPLIEEAEIEITTKNELYRTLCDCNDTGTVGVAQAIAAVNAAPIDHSLRIGLIEKITSYAVELATKTTDNSQALLMPGK